MKALKIDGVEPNAKTVADGTYPYYKPVIVVTMPKAPPLVQKFVLFGNARRPATISWFVPATWSCHVKSMLRGLPPRDVPPAG